jgi:inosine-uridine nucleoside N-ribohydrolase
MRPRVAFDMETSDPDDALTLCLLATHPAIQLVAVTVTPGTPQQVGLIRLLLERLAVSIEVRIGAGTPSRPNPNAVSGFHHRWLGDIPDATPDGIAHDILAAAAPDALVTGAPLHNLRLLLTHHPDFHLPLWVAQGGFAGDNLVAAENRLPKFAGKQTCKTFNFGGDRPGAQAALASPQIASRRLVSKNVTHGIAWDPGLQSRLSALTAADGLTPGVALMREAMAVYLARRPEGKLLHDPLAACALFDPGAFTWAEVEMYTERGEWGARAASGSRTHITIAVDWPRALAALVAPAQLP